MDGDRAVLVLGGLASAPMAAAAATGGEGEPGDTATAFAGCTSRVRLAAYMAAMTTEQRILGALVGLTIGVVAGAAGAIYITGGRGSR